jgi:tetratricopeptide (TPR) repeat protein
MDDRELPTEASSWDEAWTQLLRRPWVRPRANKRYVTLHDALAEGARRMIPLHDREERWRHDLWRRAKEIYAELTTSSEQRIRAGRGRVTGALRDPARVGQRQLVKQVTDVDADKRELDQLLTAQLHYEILDDFDAGTARFLELSGRALERGDALLMELLCHEVERFLMRGEPGEHLEDVLDVAQRKFRLWLRNEAPARHIEVAVQIAGFLVQNEQPGSALDLLTDLPDESAADPELRYRLANMRGNAFMRVAGRVVEAERYFESALRQARAFVEPARVLDEAQAYKELGFYYRNVGRWDAADAAYREARDILARSLGPGSDEAHRGEMASIQANWAYLKALRGNYRDARNLVDSSIALRRKFRQRHGEGQSLSVSGEIHRYEGRFRRAWLDYRGAEEIFHELKSWPRLGQLYQQQAICLYQATLEGITIEDYSTTLQMELARALIKQALDICRESAVRSYPSALNRAGRIYASTDVHEGINALDEGIREAERIGDGWFLSANLIEYLELNYAEWRRTENDAYRGEIDRRANQVASTIEAYHFPDLSGRWSLLQGHLLVHDADGREDFLENALQHYSRGFLILADERIGSHGSVAIPREFALFREVFDRLPQRTQRRWYERLLADWVRRDTEEPSTSLLARLEELY